jgi:hypothetical protein
VDWLGLVQDLKVIMNIWCHDLLWGLGGGGREFVTS